MWGLKKGEEEKLFMSRQKHALISDAIIRQSTTSLLAMWGIYLNPLPLATQSQARVINPTSWRLQC
jgi:hypothetical protein